MDFNSSEQTISWFRDRHREGRLKIQPPYQRKPVWAARQKCYLVESILRKLPIPEIYVQQTTSPDGETIFSIVDGQQRIRTVLQFVGSETDPGELEYNKFTLDKLSEQSEWKDKSFSDLDDDQKKGFYQYKFAVRNLNTDSDEDVRDMFTRLNRFLTPLKPQELRNATYGGPFARLALSLADDEFWLENAILKPASIRRMGDVEYMSELLIGVLHGPQGGASAVIDSYYTQYEDYDDEFPGQRKAEKLFRETMGLIQMVLPGIRETRWQNKTDFYTLFVTISSLIRTKELTSRNVGKVTEALEGFAQKVETRLADEGARVSGSAVAYVRAVEKGVNDKKRRADRQRALVSVIGRYFTPKKSPR
jgi:hypothetical protein